MANNTNGLNELCICTSDDACRLQGCNALIKFAPCGSVDRANPIASAVDWAAFQQPIDMTSFSMDRSVNTEKFRVIGSCDEFTKVNGRTWSISGDLYFCADDFAQCLIAEEGCELDFSFEPCGVDDPENEPVFYGSAVVSSYSMSVSPDDFISASFSLEGQGQLYRANFCTALNPGGADGDPTTPELNQAEKVAVGADGQDGLNGANGADGQDGADGTNGIDGIPLKAA